MYKIFLDNKILHADNIPNLKIIEPVLELEQNNYGSFEFDITNQNPMFNEIQKMKSLVTVYQNEELIFRGRVEEESEDTHKYKNVYCRGELSFLNDSIQENYSYQGSIKGFLQLLLDKHNEQVEEYKRFYVGNITVTDPNDYIVRSDTQFLNTWESIKKKLIELLGGYIIVRYVGDVAYIDYLADFPTINHQSVKFGKNMLTVNKNESGADIATIIIPLGAKDEESEDRLTIESVNNGKKYIEHAEGIKQFGRITKVVTFDDVTLAENLLSKGKQALDEACNLILSIEINAIDMASIEKDICNFRMNSKIKVESTFHGINDFFIPLKMSINLFKPEANKITLNDTKQTLTSSMNNTDTNYTNIVEAVVNIQNDINKQIPQIIYDFQQKLTTSIDQNNTLIKNDINNQYYTKSDMDVFIKSLNNSISETKKDLEEQLNSFSKEISNIQDKLCKDIDWEYLTLTDEFTPYLDLIENTPKYRIKGKVVEIRGSISPKETYDSTPSNIYFATIPEDLIPSDDICILCPGDNKDTWTFTVNKNGNLFISQYGIISNDTRLAFQITYTID